ncbi:MAG TPA: methylated-DNA--[protein]-cysteine S-methyltransferase [Burkholderiales bacterium]|jgi:methylated-DNA-[protein]-cysteine S-methyltransferase|nr:methylated-DNA--[protein]-cysteine S-methyltransferase [Burkholderiales bacterium]
MTTFHCLHDSPIGPLLLLTDGQCLTGLHTQNDKYRPHIRREWIEDARARPFDQARIELDEYFAGRRRAFTLPLNAQGTGFQRRVWEQLCAIPFGETISYGELARRVGNPNASRAVGMANSRNPISIVVPCHRVIGADKSLTGYAGGLDRKKALLEHEARLRPATAGELFGGLSAA